MVNKDGLIGCGDKICKYGYDSWYTFDKVQLQSYLQNNQQLSQIQDLKTSVVKHSIVYEKEVQPVAPRWNVDWFDMAAWSSDRKFSGVISSTVYFDPSPGFGNSFSGSFIDATAKMQRKRKLWGVFLGWQPTNVNFLSTEGFVLINGKSANGSNGHINVNGIGFSTDAISNGARCTDGIATILGYSVTFKCTDVTGQQFVNSLNQ